MTADSTVVYNAVTVKKKIIPDSTRWIDNNKAIKAGFKPGAKYKACVKMEKVNTVTVHNTEDLDNGQERCEQEAYASAANVGQIPQKDHRPQERTVQDDKGGDTVKECRKRTRKYTYLYNR